MTAADGLAGPGRSTGPRPLVLCAQPYGYGPVSKLLALAGRLQSTGIPLVFVGAGITLELAARSASLFARVLDAGPGSADAREAIAGAAGVVSVMDREYSVLATDLGRPLYVVDSLYWMRATLPPAFRGARIHWAQDFDGVGMVPGRGENVRITGPLLPPGLPRWRGGARLVVNLGGGRSPFASAPDNAAYWRFVLGGLRESDIGARYRGRILVLGGEQCLAFVRAEGLGEGFEVATLPHAAALEAFAGAAMVLSSPGLTTSLECFRMGVPVRYLPPQNYSQWCILRSLRRHGAADHAFHWEDMGEGYRLADRLDEPDRDPLIRRAIDGLSVLPRARSAYLAGLACMADGDPAAVAAAQAGYLRSLGGDGIGQVVDDLLSDLRLRP
jgi:hypothetical protein